MGQEPMGTLLSAVSPWQVTLRADAELDARRVNQYTLILRAACPNENEVERRLYVRVTTGQVLRCDAPFASSGMSQGHKLVGTMGASRHWAPTDVLCCRGRCSEGSSRCGTPDTLVRSAAAATWWADGEWWLPQEPADPPSGSSLGDGGTPGMKRGTGVPTLLPLPVSAVQTPKP